MIMALFQFTCPSFLSHIHHSNQKNKTKTNKPPKSASLRASVLLYLVLMLPTAFIINLPLDKEFIVAIFNFFLEAFVPWDTGVGQEISHWSFIDIGHKCWACVNYQIWLLSLVLACFRRWEHKNTVEDGDTANSSGLSGRPETTSGTR